MLSVCAAAAKTPIGQKSGNETGTNRKRVTKNPKRRKTPQTPGIRNLLLTRANNKYRHSVQIAAGAAGPPDLLVCIEGAPPPARPYIAPIPFSVGDSVRLFPLPPFPDILIYRPLNSARRLSITSHFPRALNRCHLNLIARARSSRPLPPAR